MPHELRIRIPEELHMALRELAALRKLSLSALAGEILAEKFSEKLTFEARVLEALDRLEKEGQG